MALEDANFIEEENYKEEVNKTWYTSFNVDGLDYATNLFWQPLQNVEDPIIDVEQAAENILEGADLYCIKSGKAPQFGICDSKEGYNKNQNVAAISASSAFSNISSFVAVFKVNNGWWYICLRNDIILSDGDMLFANEDDAKAQFESMLAVPDWGRKIAPQEWNIEGTEEFLIEDIIAKVAPVKLKKIKGLGKKLIIILGISAFLGLWILVSLIDAIFLTPPKKPVITVPPKQIKPIAPKEIIEIAPWENLINAKTVMDNCLTASMDLYEIMPPGWKIGLINCTTAQTSTSWKKVVGKVSWMKKAFEDNKDVLSSYSFSDNGQDASAVISHPAIKKQKNQPTLKADELAFELNDLFQSLGMKINLSRQSVLSETKKAYNLIAFNFVSTQNPAFWVKILTKFSGLYINNIQYNPDARSWKYEGAIYVL